MKIVIVRNILCNETFSVKKKEDFGNLYKMRFAKNLSFTSSSAFENDESIFDFISRAIVR